MARIRSIHPDACDSEKLAACTAEAERTFWRLITHLDDEGRAEDRPRLLAPKLYPLVDYKNADAISQDVDELVDVGLLVRYVVEGKPYLVCPTFGDWQKPRHPTPSKLPSPDEADATSTAGVGSPTADRRNPHAGEEGRGGGVGDGAASGTIAAELTLVSENGSSAGADGAFDEWWAMYPRKVDRSRAKAAYAKARRRAGQGVLLTALERQIAVWDRENRPGDKIPHATTWLNGERWADEALTQGADRDHRANELGQVER